LAAENSSNQREAAAKNGLRAFTDELEVRLENFAGDQNNVAGEAARLREEAAVEAARLRSESLEAQMISALRKYHASEKEKNIQQVPFGKYYFIFFVLLLTAK
jgi:hypothetical protein